jgi:hypothetical protein
VRSRMIELDADVLNHNLSRGWAEVYHERLRRVTWMGGGKGTPPGEWRTASKGWLKDDATPCADSSVHGR